MANTIVKTQTEQVESFLGNTVQQLNDFLNEVTLSSLTAETSGGTDYVNLLLSNTRRLSVFCDEGHNACQVILKSEPFRKSAAEKVLYNIYHQCIEEFFAPRNDAWYEDSRSAYTGKNSIQFHEAPPETLKVLIRQLESDFQSIREELEYYETDYRTKMIQGNR
ncbi:YpuI family protein [Sutcliffiella deserti]|uniref:YpuI family protein n=1 Tax=Sutcliffiella deserti TaxID=2875501 RepID=UPI001CBC6B0B|nr:YpuI family protein [Sutcliffiella deserti]